MSSYNSCTGRYCEICTSLTRQVFSRTGEVAPTIISRSDSHSDYYSCRCVKPFTRCAASFGIGDFFFDVSELHVLRHTYSCAAAGYAMVCTASRSCAVLFRSAEAWGDQGVCGKFCIAFTRLPRLPRLVHLTKNPNLLAAPRRFPVVAVPPIASVSRVSCEPAGALSCRPRRCG